MRFSESWLREHVSPDISTAQLVHQLTMAGLEVDSAVAAAGEFTHVVVGHIVAIEPHPEADRLRVCRVDIGAEATLQIVCGAPNARIGLRAPLALEGARLPGDVRIKAAKLRGIPSQGMLCSARELGIDEDVSGLLELPENAPCGIDLRDYLQLDDTLIEVDLTPNRADCLSIEGLAREVALLNDMPLREISVRSPVVAHGETLAVDLRAPESCPRYLGRLVKGLDRSAKTPLWMRERLRRSGIRCLDLVVDVTNYVLMEMGQPLHAFDAGRLQGGIVVRHGRAGEKLRLLNDQDVELDEDTLVIADEVKALALAGIMGGRDSAVGDETTDIFLECAFFTPGLLMGKARRYGLNTDSSHRFERGVSFELQDRALARASALIVELAGGKPGPVVEAVSREYLPLRDPVPLRFERVAKTLGLAIEHHRIERILRGLGMLPIAVDGGWNVRPPAFRFDLALEADLIEEIGRIHGYEQIPRRLPLAPAAMHPVSEARLSLSRVQDLLVDRGYQEAITYSFVERELQALVEPDIKPLALRNPLSAELGVMRTNLWPGLLDAALRNVNRQQIRVRLFESGMKFVPQSDGLEQRKAIAWLALGSIRHEQWGDQARLVDFFDMKADVEAMLALTGRDERVRFVPVPHPALHPGQSAEILLGTERLGWLGMLHPGLERRLGFTQRVFLAELDQTILLGRDIPRFAPLSRFPSMRRDIAVTTAESVPVGDLIQLVRERAGDLLREVLVFDVYQGPGLSPGQKSVALGLFWQDDTETLVDARVDECVAKVLEALEHRFGARLRT